MNLKIKKNRSVGKDHFHDLHGLKKLQYIWDYYKFPLVVLCIVLYITGYTVYGHVTHKEAVLYTAFVNVTAGEDLIENLSEHFLEARNIDTVRNEFHLYSGLYLTDDKTNPYHEYTYASHMKILAAIDAEQLDVVLMNKEAFDAFSQNGYLCDLDELLAEENPDLYETLKSYLITNTSILEDNSVALYFDESAVYTAKTEEFPMGLDLSQSPIIQDAGFEDTVYLGIILNSPRKAMAVTYLQYLYQAFSS